MQTEIARLVRHGWPMLVGYAVGAGLIPSDLQQPIIEVGLAVVSLAVSLWVSRQRDIARS